MTYGVGRIGFLLAYASWMIATGFLFKFLASIMELLCWVILNLLTLLLFTYLSSTTGTVILGSI